MARNPDRQWRMKPMTKTSRLLEAAESKFKKKARHVDAVMAEYEAAGVAIAEKTARLKSLRLAREAVAARDRMRSV